MSYKNAACCASGLGQGLSSIPFSGDEDPTVLTQTLTRLHLGFQSTLQKLPSGNAFLADYAMRIQSWFGNANADMARHDFRNARIKVNALERMVPDFGRRVGEAIVGGTKALEQARVGSSWLNQVLGAVGLLPEGSFYRPESKAADTIEAGGWLLALAAGATGLLVLSMVMKR